MASNDVLIQSFGIENRCSLTHHGVEAELSPAYNRKPSSELDRIIKEAWDKAVLKNSHLFDGSKFRLAAVDVDPSKVSLKLGLTSYGQFLGTNCLERQQIEAWQAKGLATFDDASAFFANPLGVGALVRTADHRFVFMRRSAICGEAQGLIDRPGGHPEPETLNISLEDQPLPASVTSETLVKEIFDSAMREVRDEIGVPLETLCADVRLMGIVYNKAKGNRPSAEFYMSTTLSSQEINDIYQNGQIAEKYESTEIIFVDEEEFASISGNSESGILQQRNLAPAAIGCLMLYSKCKAM